MISKARGTRESENGQLWPCLDEQSLPVTCRVRRRVSRVRGQNVNCPQVSVLSKEPQRRMNTSLWADAVTCAT